MNRIMIVLFLLLSWVNFTHANSVELSSQEEDMLREYLEQDKGNVNVKLPNLVAYISEVINISKEKTKILNMFLLTEAISDFHRTLLEEPIKNFIRINLTNGELKKDDTLKTLRNAILALGKIRTESSLQFLRNLIVPKRLWKEPDGSKVIFYRDTQMNEKDINKTHQDIEITIRQKALSAYLNSDETDTVTLLIDPVEKEIESFDTNDPAKSELLRCIDLYKQVLESREKGIILTD